MPKGGALLHAWLPPSRNPQFPRLPIPFAANAL
jgi:hypothetical protein